MLFLRDHHVYSRLRKAFGALAAAVLVVGSVSETAAVELARGGKAMMPVVVGAGADERTVAAAEDLAGMLSRISGGEFAVEVGDGSAGIVVGESGDFAALPFPAKFETSPIDPDHYGLVSRDGALYVIGSTPRAVEFGVWDLLYRLGHRQYFPGERWEIVPERADLALVVDTLERPDYLNRSGPRGAARVAHRHWLGDGFETWRKRNRTSAGFDLATGHAYDAIVRRNKEAFDAHPEYFALVDGKREERVNPKFCIGNEGLRKLVVEDAIRQVEANPEAASISMDPSDGSGWCDADCPVSSPLGSVSDRVVILANDVAAALEKEFGRTIYVGIYAYNDYSPPPSVALHPNVIPSLATAFIRGNFTFEDMLEGWSSKSNLLGIREYYGVAAWNSAMPGRARAADTDYLARTIPEFHQAGARFMNAESDDSWGPNGLGHWLAARMLWDVSEAERVDELVDDFVENAFGEAREPMRRFYDTLTGRPQVSEHLVGTMYRLLEEARGLTSDEDALARIDDLVLYTRFVELHRAFTGARTEEQQAAFDDLMEFTWRTRGTLLVDALGIIDWLQRQQRGVEHLSWADGYLKVVPSDIHRQRENDPISASEIRQIAARGIAANGVIGFEPVGFSHRLVPAFDALGMPDAPALPRAIRTRARTENYTWIPKAPGRVELEIRTGLLYDNRGPATVALEWWDEDLDEFTPVATAEVEPDGDWRTVVLETSRDGLHRVVWNERMSGTEARWPQDLPRTTPSGEEHLNITVGRDNWFFYVPKGTASVGIFAEIEGGQLLDGNGLILADFNDGGRVSDYLSFPVPPGADGKLWSFRNLSGHVRLLTVPPYTSNDPRGLLLPRELVDLERVANIRE